MEITLLTEIIAVTLVLFYLLGIVCAVEAVIKGRTAQGATAWAISLLTLPYLAVPCYWVFGRNRFDGYLQQRDQISQESLELIERTSDSVEQHIIPRSSDATSHATRDTDNQCLERTDMPLLVMSGAAQNRKHSTKVAKLHKA
jgi:cardiolipin synthase